MKFEKSEKYICTVCGFMTTQKPDEEGYCTCGPCFHGMTLEEYEEFCKKMGISGAR
jgi:hypothetical protein